ncbi:RidA family protein [Microvirga mediterraneensis]|uniref:RidA family protein n=1 Tax=Microvirga mediterraneensis TaxID=2754695 RepID=A0A838BNF2_9HYPH|nr:RidA family protein [Microvirga mediterraneensis]MBA1156599.1 RidA family protein [Microvirga mediterraneensis]
MSTSTAERLQELGLALPQVSTPVANYIPWTRSGDLVFISGQISQENGRPAYIGRLGDTISIEDGRRAAELCALNLLAHINAIACGELARVRRIVRLGGFVSCVADFHEQPQVINGASDLMFAVFGENGRHARTAVGVISLPRGVAVEVDATVEIAF